MDVESRARLVDHLLAQVVSTQRQLANVDVSLNELRATDGDRTGSLPGDSPVLEAIDTVELVSYRLSRLEQIVRRIQKEAQR